MRLSAVSRTADRRRCLEDQRGRDAEGKIFDDDADLKRFAVAGADGAEGIGSDRRANVLSSVGLLRRGSGRWPRFRHCGCRAAGQQRSNEPPAPAGAGPAPVC